MTLERKLGVSKFAPGDAIVVDRRPVSGHCRTPWYLRGHRGTIAAVQGIFRNPEQLAYHKPGLPKLVLYKVRFPRAELWPQHPGSASDEIEADIYEHWIRPQHEEKAHHERASARPRARRRARS